MILFERATGLPPKSMADLNTVLQARFGAALPTQRTTKSKKASSARQKRALQARQAKAAPPPGKGRVATICGTLYSCGGWNQVPSRILLKHMARGPRGAHALSFTEQFLFNKIMGAKGGDGSDSEEDDLAPRAHFARVWA